MDSSFFRSLSFNNKSKYSTTPKIEIISREIIKPSSPTRKHLLDFQLSLLDQIAPPVFIPFVLFYHDDNSGITSSRRVHSLKNSLSQVLSVFYPLAGRINKESVVECDDSGVDFIEARVHGRTISKVIEECNTDEMTLYLPFKPLSPDKEVMLGVKVSFFDCGGVAIGICLSHKIGDGTSLMAFIDEWAKATLHSKLTDVANPSFDLASFFPPRDDAINNVIDIGITDEKIETTRLTFDKDTLAKIKCIIASEDETKVEDPTRVEALSTLLWRCFNGIAEAKNGKKVFSIGIHAVNLRPRTNPPCPENIFGNCWGTAIALLDPEESPDLATKFRGAIRNVSGGYMKEEKYDEYLNHWSKFNDYVNVKGAELCFFTSWCRFPAYMMDFGWGKPSWVCTTPLPCKNLVILISTPCGEGIEAWVNTLEEDVVEMHERIANFLNPL